MTLKEKIKKISLRNKMFILFAVIFLLDAVFLTPYALTHIPDTTESNRFIAPQIEKFGVKYLYFSAIPTVLVVYGVFVLLESISNKFIKNEKTRKLPLLILGIGLSILFLLTDIHNIAIILGYDGLAQSLNFVVWQYG